MCGPVPGRCCVPPGRVVSSCPQVLLQPGFLRKLLELEVHRIPEKSLKRATRIWETQLGGDGMSTEEVGSLGHRFIPIRGFFSPKQQMFFFATLQQKCSWVIDTAGGTSLHTGCKVVDLALSSHHMCQSRSGGRVFFWCLRCDNICADCERGTAWPEIRGVYWKQRKIKLSFRPWLPSQLWDDLWVLPLATAIDKRKRGTIEL